MWKLAGRALRAHQVLDTLREEGRPRPRDRPHPCWSSQCPGRAGTPLRHHVPPALNAVFPLPLGGHCHAPAPGEAESAGVLSCVCPEASPWGSSPAPGSELSSAAGVGHGVGEGEPSEPS